MAGFHIYNKEGRMIQEDKYKTLRTEFRKSFSELEITERKPCLLVIGRKNTGKNKLIKNLFGEVETDKIEQLEDYTIYTYRDIKILRYDIHESANYRDVLTYLLNKIDFIWYCSTANFLLKKDWDIRVLISLQNYSPTALIVTSLKKWIFSSNIKSLQDRLDLYYNGDVFPAYIKLKGIRRMKKEENWWGLLSWSLSTLEDVLQKDLVVSPVSLVSTELLNNQRSYIVKKVIPSYTSGACAIGAVPIPFSDAMLLIPEQVAMTMHILKIYGLENSGKIVSGLIRSTLISQLGRMLAGSLIKLIPGFGSISGSIINGTVAGSFTWILGMSVSEIAFRYRQAVDSGMDIPFENYFNIDTLKTILDEFQEKEYIEE